MPDPKGSNYNLAKILNDERRKKVVRMLYNAAEKAEPSLIRRRRQLIDHLKLIDDMDKECVRYYLDKQAFHVEHSNATEIRIQSEQGRQSRIHKGEAGTHRLREMKQEYDQIDLENRKLELAEKHEKWRQVEIRDHEKLTEASNVELAEQYFVKRSMDSEYWSKQASRFGGKLAVLNQREENLSMQNKLNAMHLLEAEAQNLQNVDRMDEEYLPELDPLVRNLGIFGSSSAMDSNARNSRNRSHSILNDPHIHTEHEKERLQLCELQSELAKIDRKNNERNRLKNQAKHEKQSIESRINRVHESLNAVEIEEQAYFIELAGPPRRDPTEDEIKLSYSRAQRLKDLKLQLEQSNSRIMRIDQEATFRELQNRNFKSLRCQLQTRCTILEEKVADWDMNQNELPIVVGNALSQKSPEFQSQSKKANFPSSSNIKQLIQESEFEIIKNKTSSAFSSSDQRTALKIEGWKRQRLQQTMRTDLSIALSRFSAVAQNIEMEKQHEQKQNLLLAMQEFHKRQLKLHGKPLSLDSETRNLCWWSLRDTSKLQGIINLSNDTKGVQSVERQIGQISGSTTFNWNCRFSVALKIRFPRCPSCKIRISLGVSESATSSVVYSAFNSDDSYEPNQTIEKLFEGEALHYKFNITRETVHHTCTIAIENGIATTLVLNKKDLPKYRFKSDFAIKVLEDSGQTKSRTTLLVEELIKVDESTTSLWDSSVLHGHHQRFKRIEFAKQLRNAIKDEISISIDQEANRRKLCAVKDETSYDSDHRNSTIGNSNLDRVDLSAMAVVNRGKHKAMKLIESEKSLVGRQLKISRVELGSWHVSQATEARIEWREGGKAAMMHHKIRHANTGSPRDFPMSTWSVMQQEKYLVLVNQAPYFVWFVRKALHKFRRVNKIKEEANRVHEASGMHQIKQIQGQHQKEIAIFEFLAAKNIKRIENYSKIAADRYFQTKDGIRTLEIRAERLKFESKRNGMAISPSDASLMAKKEVLTEKVESNVKRAVEYWKRSRKRRVQKQHDNLMSAEEERSKLLADSLSAYEKQVNENSETFCGVVPSIQNFAVVLSPNLKCSHLKVKHWGNSYASGVKCLSCGKEMSRTYEDSNHSRGHDVKLDMAIEQERMMGGNYVASHPSVLRAIDNERARLEKEAREIELNEIQFYDFRNLKAIELINYRHGIQERSPTNDVFNERSVYDAHVASFKEDKQFYGRINQFRSRINKIVETRVELNKNRLQLLDSLNQSHIDIARLEVDAVELIREHQHAWDILEYRQDVCNVVNTSRKGLKLALKDQTMLNSNRLELEMDAKVSSTVSGSLNHAVLEMTQYQKKFNQRNAATTKCQSNFDHSSDRNEAAHLKNTAAIQSLLLKKRGRHLCTAFGTGTVHAYRENDSILDVRLSQSKYRFHTAMWKFRWNELRSQHENIIGMTCADFETSEYYRKETECASAELILMRKAETELYPVAKWEDVNSERHEFVKKHISFVEVAAHASVMLKSHKKATQARASEMVEKAMQRGSAADRSHWESRKNKLLRACIKRLSMEEVESRILSVRGSLDEFFDQISVESIKHSSCESFFFRILTDIIHEICTLSIRQDVDAHQRLQMESGFSVSIYQYSSFQHLELYRLHTRRQSHNWAMSSAWYKQLRRLRFAQAEINTRKAAETRQIEARKRRLAVCKKMRAEELLTKAFYQAELALALRERRIMKANEDEMRLYLRELAAIEFKFASGNVDVDRQSENEARRLQIKRGKFENKRLRREWQYMEAEDKRSYMHREYEANEVRIKFLEEEFICHRAMIDSDSGDGFSSDSSDSSESAVEHHGKLSKNSLRQRAMRRRMRRLKRAAIIAKRKEKGEIENEYAVEFVKFIASASYISAFGLEIARCVNLYGVIHSKKTQEGINFKHCFEKKVEENDALSTATLAKNEASFLRNKLCDQCDQHVKKLSGQMIQYERQRLSVIRETEYMDTMVLHRRSQRFNTEYLEKRLHTSFFACIVRMVILRAESIILERRGLHFSETIQGLIFEAKTKKAAMSRLWIKNTRKSRLRLRRSELGKIIFARSRATTLKNAFRALHVYWVEVNNVRTAFDLKYSLAYQEQFFGELRKKANSSKPMTNNSTETIMASHQMRWTTCRNCKSRYSETQNNRNSCSFHPGTYEICCQSGCQTRMGLPLTSQCIKHRERRWTCCDNTVEGKFGNSGCSVRFHMPPRGEPLYSDLVSSKLRGDAASMDTISHEISVIKSRNLANKSFVKRKDMLRDMSDKLKKQRETCLRFNPTQAEK